MRILTRFVFFLIFIITTCFAQKKFFGNEYSDTVYSYNKFQSKIDTNKIFKKFFVYEGTIKGGSGYFYKDHFVNTEFFKAEFNNICNFSFSTFDVEVDFSESKFNSLALFDKVRFKKNIYFFKSLFKSDAYFTQTIFKGKVSFANCIFKDNLYFNRTTFEEIPDFHFCYLPEFLDFSEVKIDIDKISQLNQKIDFRLCKIDSLTIGTNSNKCKIMLEGTDLNRILLPHDLFELSFREESTYEVKSNIYESIIKTCKDNGMTESEKDWDIDYQKFQNEHDYPILGASINYINEFWWGFGHEKWKILWIWLPLFFFLFTLYNCFRIETLYNKMYCDEELGSTFLRNLGIKKNYYGIYEPDFSKRRYRVSYAIFYTAAIYFGFKLKHEAVNYMYARGFLYLYLIYLVGAIHVAFGLSYILNIY